MKNLRKNIIISSLCLIFGIYIISIFSSMIIKMDIPFWMDLPRSLTSFLSIISGIFLIYSVYVIIRKKILNKYLSIVFLVFSIPLFYVQVMYWKLFIEHFPRGATTIFDYFIVLFIFFFSFGFSGLLLLYAGYRIFREKKIFF